MPGSETSPSASSSLMGLKVRLMNFPGCFLIRLCEEGGKGGGSVVFEGGFPWFASRVAIDLNVLPVLAKLLSSEVRILSD